MSIFDNFSRKELEDVLHKHETWAGIVKDYGVSDAAIRKWCKSYDLPYQSLKIKKISDEDWEKI